MMYYCAGYSNVAGAVFLQNYKNTMMYIEYKDGKPDPFLHSEGTVRMDKDGQFKYYFVLRDHLGNTRVTFSDLNNDDEINVKEEIIQINNYYAFGLNMEGNWNGKDGANAYQYNGKEWNDDFGLGWNDYGARFYDPAAARWHSVDPLAEKYMNLSPYNYVSNNPILFIDPNGKEIRIYYGASDYVIYRDGQLYDSGGENLWAGTNEFVTNVATSLAYLSDSETATNTINNLVKSGISYRIIETSGATRFSAGEMWSTIEFNPYQGVEDSYSFIDPAQLNAAIALSHEMDHAEINDDSWVAQGKPTGMSNNPGKIWGDNPDNQPYKDTGMEYRWQTPEEKKIIEGKETKVIQELIAKGHKPEEGLKPRTSHIATNIPTPGPTRMK